jgi:hypothetical protein
MYQIDDRVVIVTDNFFTHMTGRVAEVDQGKILIEFEEMDMLVLFNEYDLCKLD